LTSPLPCHCELSLDDAGTDAAADGGFPVTATPPAGLDEPVPAPLLAALGGRFIDAHAHLFPDRLLAAIWKAFRQDGYVLQHEADSDTVRRRLLATGADRLFVLVYAHKPGVAAALNAWLHETTRHEPRLVPFGSVHAGDADRAAIVERCFRDYGFAGLKLHASVQRTACDDARLDPVYAACIAHRRWVVLHAGTAPYEDAYTGVASAERLLVRHPELRVIFAHLGMWEIEAFGRLARRHPNVYLDCSSILGYPRFNGELDPAWLRAYLIEHVDKILWGSDFPYLETPYATPLQALVDLGLSADQLARLRDGNARAVLASVGGDLPTIG
jgi:predicted TIM-barrel fold metal-dependent hydrolase